MMIGFQSVSFERCPLFNCGLVVLIEPVVWNWLASSFGLDYGVLLGLLSVGLVGW